MKTILQSLRILILLTVLTGIIYPLFVTGIASHLFPSTANGSLINKEKTLIGSSLLSQKCDRADLFWPRPSGADYATLPSGASNLGPTSSALAKAIDDRRTLFGQSAPIDLLTASGSGLDPDVSPEAALFQVPRIASARHLSQETIQKLVQENIQSRQFGILGLPRVNVLALNLALEQLR